MDGFNEKKWFVYVGDHHEGPFSLADIQQKMTTGEVSTSSYVWAEGMGDWKVMTDVPAFESLLGGASASAPTEIPSEPSSAPGPVLEAVGEPSLPQASSSGGGPLLEAADGGALHSNHPGPTEIDTSSFMLTEAPSASTSLGIPAPKADVIEDEKTGDLDPKARKKAEKEAAKAAAREEKERIKAEKAAKKRGAATAAATGIGVPGGAVSMGGERFVPKLIRMLIKVGIAGAAFGAYKLGYLDPVLESPQFKAVGTTASELTRPYLVKLIDKVPAVGTFISPVSKPDDVSDEDFEELKAAALGAPEEKPKAAVALGRAEPLEPTFYVTTNLPDGANFIVHVEGVEDSLLNHSSYSDKKELVVAQRLGHTDVYRMPDKKPLPRGEYMITVVEAETQPDEVKNLLAAAPPVAATLKLPAELPVRRKIAVKKILFLGGQKDATYKTRLKEYHDKIRAKATTELMELKQFATTLESQLGNSTAAFTRGYNRKGKAGRPQAKAWETAHRKWVDLDSQIASGLQKASDPGAQGELFFSQLYSAALETSMLVRKVHEQHHAYFTGAFDPKTFQATLEQAVSQAQASVQSLKQKVEQVEKAPPTAAGLPRRITQ